MEILRALMEEHQLVAIPELPVLDQPYLQRHEHFAPQLVESLAKYRVVQLEGAFTKYPLAFKRRTAGSAVGTYYPYDAIGPRIRWTLPGVVDETRRTITPGSIGHLKTYWEPDLGEWKPASAEIVAGLQGVVRTMKKHLVKITVSRDDSKWVGRKTKEQLENGEVRIDR